MQEFKVHYSYLSGHGFFTMTVMAESQNDAKKNCFRNPRYKNFQIDLAAAEDARRITTGGGFCVEKKDK